MSSVESATAAGLLRPLRESHGWSWADLARALRDTARRLEVTSLRGRQVTSIQRTIARGESPTHRTAPGERYQILLAHLYARNPADSLNLGPGSDFEILIEALRGFGIPEQRVEYLITMIAPNSPRPTPHGFDVLTASSRRGPRSPVDNLVDRIATAVTTINAHIGSAFLVRLQLALAPTITTCRQLTRPAQPSPGEDATRAWIPATSALGLAARLAFKTTDDEAAETLYREAAATANRLHDRRHRAAIQTSHTRVTLHATGTNDRARQIAHSAVTEAHRSASPAHRARAHAVHAEVSARTGDEHQAFAALDRARAALEQLPAGQQPTGCNADRVDGFDGLCALHLGNATRAHDRLERSLATLTGPRDAVQRGIVSSDLALARLQLGDPTACAIPLHDAVELASTAGGRVPAQRIRHARHALRHSRADTVLAELDDHIHDRLVGR